MNEIKIKNKKHIIIMKVPSDMSVDALTALTENINKMVPELNVLITQSETELTVLTLED